MYDAANRLGPFCPRPDAKFAAQECAMISFQSKAALTVLLLLTFSAASSRAQMAANRDADTAAIKQCVAAFVDSWNSHDAHAVAMHYVEDGDFSSVKGEASHGRKELEDHYVTVFGTFLKNAHTTDTVKSIRYLAPDIASVDIDWLVTEPNAPGGVLRKGLLTWIVTKRNGQWMITVYHESAF
jgi:uncharacterized protein (TIGR02246 family)